MKRPVLAVALFVALAGCAGDPAIVTPGPTASSAAASAAATPSGAPAATSVAASTPPASADLEAKLDTLLAAGFNGSALVAKGGTVLVAKGVGMADDARGFANAPTTRFRIGSVTKQFTAMAILMLEAQGLVKPGDSICAFIDPCPTTWTAVTIEHLLGHTSGIADFTEQPGFDPMTAATPAETVASVAAVPLPRPPGASFSYTNTGYVLLGMVVEKASGSSYEAFLGERIFGPLGMTDSGYEHGATPGLATGYGEGFTPAEPLDMSVPYAAGGLYSTVVDLHRWTRALTTDQLAPAASMVRYVTPLTDTTDRVGFGYAYGQYVGDERGARLVWHDGGINGFASQLSRYPDDGITVVLLANRESSPDLASLARVVARLAREQP